ncbi:phosphomethylpyrimidine synthase ThiC [Desulfobacca acetoxidans]|uniref:Phosphomethylpyrimidine synthase n=1 Tax=Desulfobacca acetoxidans (strain ATCC 700848 / DSM 11109 / ASRB2) TaxID=880072 RepID=F2NIN8_DESAR|nr:phosphomethylpyrimidine synthase ThiC [Desulfobacca acetoxidans]AEB10513.1 Phosphomethylpyrimidine synthase [Desulfobacca acetoxidans DSM 11109]
MTQRETALAGHLTPAMIAAAQKEGMPPEFIRTGLAQGTLAIPANVGHHNLDPIAIGTGVRVKINANLGASPHDISLAKEREKLAAAIRYGAHTVMDLSTGGDLNAIRTTLLSECPLPFGTVPVYQVMAEAKRLDDITADHLLEAVRLQAQQGVDFVTVHCGVTRKALPLLKNRVTGVVSRGGAFLVAWMRRFGRENPLFERFDELLDIARTYDVTLSLGDGLRPGCLADANDRAQFHELRVLGQLTQRAWAAGVQVIIEGPGHVPLHLIKKNIRLQQKYCHGAPFYVLGPLVTDVAAGYDHIAGAIGGTLAASLGAAFLCYVTPAEHLKLPEVQDVIDGVIASRIAAHAADIARGLPGAADWDLKISQARRALDWETQIGLSVNPDKARQYRLSSRAKDDQCTMCGRFCAMKVFDERFDEREKD